MREYSLNPKRCITSRAKSHRARPGLVIPYKSIDLACFSFVSSTAVGSVFSFIQFSMWFRPANQMSQSKSDGSDIGYKGSSLVLLPMRVFILVSSSPA